METDWPIPPPGPGVSVRRPQRKLSLDPPSKNADCTYIVSTKTHSDRVNLRIDPKVKANLLKAAKASRRSLTDFVLASAVASAEDVLAGRTTFVLSPKE